MTKSEIEEIVEFGYNSAVETGYIAENGSHQELADNAYEIIELGCGNYDADIDDMSDEDYEYAESYLLNNF